MTKGRSFTVAEVGLHLLDVLMAGLGLIHSLKECMLGFTSAGTLLALLIAAEHDLDTTVVALLAGSIEEVATKQS
jgi:hypothetical protein